MKQLIGAAAALALMLPGAAVAQDTIKIGILVALEGAFAAGGADGVRNVELALKQAGGMAGGKKIETVVAATDTTPDTTTRHGAQAHRAGQGRHHHRARFRAPRASPCATTPRRFPTRP